MLNSSRMALFDLTSAWVEGQPCPLASYIITVTAAPAVTVKQHLYQPRAPLSALLGVTEQAHDGSYRRTGLPLYCTHCTFMNELLPIKWYGMPLYPSHPPDDYDVDPCVWYWYKNPTDIPERGIGPATG